MLLVIFGAGASYDSAPMRRPERFPNDEYRPPLAKQLFEDRPVFRDAMRRFQACLPVIPRLQREEVEGELENLLREADGYPQRHRQLAAIKYYLQYTLWECGYRWSDQALRGVSNYTTLLDAIEHRRLKAAREAPPLGSYTEVLLVTFNYDTLLEIGLKDALGFEALSIPDYIEEARPYKLIKVHGST